MMINLFFIGLLVLLYLFMYESGAVGFRKLIATSFICVYKGKNVMFNNCYGQYLRALRFKSGGVLNLSFATDLHKGSCYLKILNEHYKTIAVLNDDCPALALPIEANYRYTLCICFKEAGGNYTLDWH